jgi:hypothetical protein
LSHFLDFSAAHRNWCDKGETGSLPQSRTNPEPQKASYNPGGSKRFFCNMCVTRSPVVCLLCAALSTDKCGTVGPKCPLNHDCLANSKLPGEHTKGFLHLSFGLFFKEMTNKETVTRNVGLSFDFIKQMVKNPTMIDEIENNSTIEFLQKDYPEREKTKKIIADKFIKVKRDFEMI